MERPVEIRTRSVMAYVDQAFPISDDDIMMDGAYFVQLRAPVKEIAFSLVLLFIGGLGIVFGSVMAINRVGGDRTHGVLFAIIGSMLFIPGSYYTLIAYYAHKGYTGFSFANIPSM